MSNLKPMSCAEARPILTIAAEKAVKENARFPKKQSLEIQRAINHKNNCTRCTEHYSHAYLNGMNAPRERSWMRV